ncbi:MAG: hypothetical protein IJO76_05810 [Clostridia bacterium]|nr:hypothetical protein [Clostridia bacterium]
MNKLYAGYAATVITPPMGIGISGYFKDRFASGVLDDLYARAVALRAGEDTVVLIAVDICLIETPDFRRALEQISADNGLPMDHIFMTCTHTHTSPFVNATRTEAIDKAYPDYFNRRVSDAVKFAIADLKPAKLGWAVGKAENVAFVRRFRMKDGSCRTNPGVGNPDVVHPIGDVDERLNVVRIDRENAETIVISNFANHPDTIGGDLISADWPGLSCVALERAIPGVKALFLNGTQGDVNHININAKGGDLNNMFHDFDDVHRGYAHAKHIANVVAGGIMSVYEKVNYIDVDEIRCKQELVPVPANKATAEELVQAHIYKKLHEEGHDDQIPFEGMELTTVVAEALRMVKLAAAPDTFDLLLSSVAVGDLAFIGIPGEPFTGIGRGLKENKSFDLVLPCCITNGYEGYFPMQDSYDEGGYEARSSNYKAGTAELIIKKGNALLDTL